MRKYDIGINRACKIINLSKTVYYYQPQLPNDDQIKEELRLLTQQHPSRGFNKFFNELRNKGYTWNHKRVYRVYCEMNLNLKRKTKKRLPSRNVIKLQQPLNLNEYWSIDFMSDVTTDSRKFRTLNVLDDFNRECLGIRIARSFPAKKVTEALDEIALGRGYSKKIRLDNGPEYISKEFVDWANKHHIELCYIQPGKPAQNGYVERFNRTYREEILDMYMFDSIEEAEIITEKWLDGYNNNRPHEALNNVAPRQFCNNKINDFENINNNENLNISTYNWY